MFKLFFSTIILFVFTKNLNAAALECQVDDYLFENSDVILINTVDLEVQPLVSMDGFYVIKSGEFVTKLDTYCSFNMLSNYHSNFIQFEKGDL